MGKKSLTKEEAADQAILEEKAILGKINEEEKVKLHEYHQKALFDKNAKMERIAARIADRKKLKEKIVGQYVPSMQEGSMSKARHLAGLTAEGVAAELIIDLLIFAFEIIDNSYYKDQTQKYDAALKQEHEAFIGGNKIHLVYPGESGKLPKIYDANPDTGELNYDVIVKHEDVTPFLIRANGLIPKPTFQEGLAAAFDRHIERMNDSSWLRPDQRLRIHGVLDQADHMSKGRDLAADRAAQAAAAARFAKPGGK